MYSYKRTRAHSHGIEFIGILRNLFLKLVKIEDVKRNIHKWNYLPLDGKRIVRRLKMNIQSS